MPSSCSQAQGLGQEYNCIDYRGYVIKRGYHIKRGYGAQWVSVGAGRRQHWLNVGARRAQTFETLVKCGGQQGPKF